MALFCLCSSYIIIGSLLPVVSSFIFEVSKYLFLYIFYILICNVVNYTLEIKNNLVANDQLQIHHVFMFVLHSKQMCSFESILFVSTCSFGFVISVNDLLENCINNYWQIMIWPCIWIATCTYVLLHFKYWIILIYFTIKTISNKLIR